MGACAFSFAFLACADIGFDGSRSRSEEERTAVVEVSTTLHPDALVPFGCVQLAIESILCDGTSAAADFESLQAERSTERDGRRGRVSKRGQEQFDQLSEATQGPFPSLVGMSSLCRNVLFVFARRGQLQHKHTKDLRTVQLERGLKIIDSPAVVFDETEDDGTISQRQRVVSCSATWSKSRISTIRSLSVSHLFDP